jgi:pilus assembly protein CpaF
MIEGFDIEERSLNNSVWKFIYDLSKKSGISEIIINSDDNIFVERSGEMIRLNVKLERDDIYLFCDDVASFNETQFDHDHPIIDGNLYDGSRINIINENYSSQFPAITIRKYLKSIKSLDSSAGVFGMGPKWIELIKALVYSRLNIMVSGGTGAGKTTLLNLMLQEISPSERIITIEDTRELRFKHPNRVSLEAKIKTVTGNPGLTIRDLLKNSLRMRPDRIIVGESRGAEIFDLLQAMNTGHQGSMSSIHANNPAECIGRIENLFLLSGYDVPLKAIRYQISTAIDVIIQINRTKDGQRVIQKVCEVTGMEQDTVLLQDIGVHDPDSGTLKFSGLVPKNINALKEFGISASFFS